MHGVIFYFSSTIKCEQMKMGAVLTLPLPPSELRLCQSPQLGATIFTSFPIREFVWKKKKIPTGLLNIVIKKDLYRVVWVVDSGVDAMK